MEITVGELFGMKQPLERLIECTVPLKTAFAIKKLTEACNTELLVVGKMHDDLVTEYGEEVPPGSKNYAVLPTSKKYPKFKKKLDELNAIEVEINVVPILLPATTQTEAKVLMALQKFIKVG